MQVLSVPSKLRDFGERKIIDIDISLMHELAQYKFCFEFKFPQGN